MAGKYLFGHLNKRQQRIFIDLLNRKPLAVMRAVRELGAIPPANSRGRRTRMPATSSLEPGHAAGQDLDLPWRQEEKLIEKGMEKLKLLPRTTFVGLPKPKLFAADVARAKKELVEGFVTMAQACRHQPIRQLRAHLSPQLGKCAKCGRYFLAANARKGRRYCPRKLRNCASNATAKAAVYRKRAAEKQESLARAQAAIRSWPGTGNWKDAVANRTGLTRKFITQATNRGDLKAPRSIPHRRP